MRVCGSQTAKLNHSAAATGDNFGVSVSISQDRIVVGADGVDGVGVSEGAAYVFDRAGMAWVESATLKAMDAGAFDFFGQSVAVFGDAGRHTRAAVSAGSLPLGVAVEIDAIAEIA